VVRGKKIYWFKVKSSLYVLYSALVVIIFAVLLSGCCAGLSQQYRASTEGISVIYTVKKEQFADPKVKVFVSSSDDRLDKEVIGDGAKPSVGRDVYGYVAFGLIYALAPDEPTFETQLDPVRIFETAMIERLAKNGIIVTSDTENGVLSLDLVVRQFQLDFNFGKWTGEVGYVARMKKGGEIICENNVYEKVTAFNLYGFGSGEEAINEAFNKAIDKLNVNSCFSKGQK
jgi:hypothetical protein